MQFLKKAIIGFVILIGLVIQVPLAKAIYSPTISREVSLIKQHILAARQQNGSGTILSAAEKVSQQDTKLREQNKAVGLPAKATMSNSQVMWQSFKEMIMAPLDSLYMVFNMIPSTNNAVSDCLRDDIWILEDIRDSVSREMIKAYLMIDVINGDILAKDFKYLTENIFILKKYGNHPQETISSKGMTSSEYLFGYSSDLNSYVLQFPSEERKSQIQDMERCIEVCKVVLCSATDNESECENKCEDECDIGAEITWSGCPQSDFLAAFEEVRNSWETLKVVGLGGGASWGSIWEMAKARARIKADQWIKANQISLTIGGVEGGNLISMNLDNIVKGGGFDKFVAKIQTEWEIVKDMVGPLVPLFSWNLYETIGEGVAVGFGADTDILADNEYCMYSYPDDGVFRACTSDQLWDYQTCMDLKSNPEKELTPEEKDIPCNRYRNPTEVRVATEIVESYQKEAEEQQKTVQRVETAFVYNTQLNSVGETVIMAMDIKLSEMNTQIRRGFEMAGDKSGPGLPSLYNKIAELYKKHCPNKQ